MTFFDEGAVVWMPFGACRHMPSSPGLTCPMLPPTLPAMSVRCTMTCPPMRMPLGEPDCCFFVERPVSRDNLELTSRSLRPGAGPVETTSGLCPVYFPAGRYVLFSDIPNNRIMRFSEDDGHLSVYRQPSMNSNGNTIDREGRLITCEHSGRRVTRTELDGSITIIADKHNGKKLNSPNDAVVAADGSIWFCDPAYGIGGYYEGIKAEPEQEKKNVYRVDPKSGDIKMVVDDFVEPNGLCFSPDEKKLYVCDTGFTDGPDNPSDIRVFDVDLGAGKVSNSKVFADMPKPSITDGVRCDTEGRVWCSVGWGDPNEDGVRCYTKDGDLLGKIHIPETVANLCFGGQQRNRLYICGSTSLYAVYTSVQGALKP